MRISSTVFSLTISCICSHKNWICDYIKAPENANQRQIEWYNKWKEETGWQCLPAIPVLWEHNAYKSVMDSLARSYLKILKNGRAGWGETMGWEHQVRAVINRSSPATLGARTPDLCTLLGSSGTLIVWLLGLWEPLLNGQAAFWGLDSCYYPMRRPVAKVIRSG